MAVTPIFNRPQVPNTSVHTTLDGGGSGSTGTINREETVSSTTQNIGDRVVDVSLLAFARRRMLIVEGSMMRPDTDYIRLYWTLDNPLDALDTEIFFDSFSIAGTRFENLGSSENWDQWKGSSATVDGVVVQYIKTDSRGYFKCGIMVPDKTSVGPHVLEALEEGSEYNIAGKDTRATGKYQAYGIHQQIEPTIVTTQVINVRDEITPQIDPEDPPPTPPGPPSTTPLWWGDVTCNSTVSEAVYNQVTGNGQVTSHTASRQGVRKSFSRTQVYDAATNTSTWDGTYTVVCVDVPPTDPLAESFFTPEEPVYISGFGLYFKTKAATLPVTLQVREMINGSPGPKIVPGSTVELLPDDISISTDASIQTRFNFTEPVYLEARTSYCFVVLCNTTEYEIHVSELGAFDTLTGNIISKQPVAGSMFMSQNNETWTPMQNEDIKFVIYKANFRADGSNEYIELPEMTGVEAFSLIQQCSQIMLASTEINHPETAIKWYYKFSRSDSSIVAGWLPFKPGINLNLENLTASVKLRVEFSGGTLTPVINNERAGIIFVKNLLRGAYVTRTVNFSTISDPQMKPNMLTGLFKYKIPALQDNIGVRISAAINDHLDDPSNIDWQYLFTLKSGGVDAILTDTYSTNPARSVVNDNLEWSIIDLDNGYYEIKFTYNFQLDDTIGIEDSKLKIDMFVVDGYQAFTPLIKDLRLIYSRR